MKQAALVLLCVLFVVSAAAATTQKERQVQPCENRGSQAEATDCSYREYKAADAQLNQIYAKLAAALDDEDKAQLKESELAWIKFRDSYCSFESSQYKGGTMRPMIENFCLARVTKSHAAELKDQYDLRK
jgi:uncharacterized protein YecT (DUF1311 family)